MLIFCLCLYFIASLEIVSFHVLQRQACPFGATPKSWKSSPVHVGTGGVERGGAGKHQVLFAQLRDRDTSLYGSDF